MNKTEIEMVLSSDEQLLHLSMWRHPHKGTMAKAGKRIEKVIKTPLKKMMDIVFAMTVESWISRTFWTRGQDRRLPASNIEGFLNSSWEQFISDSTRVTISTDYVIDKGLHKELVTVTVSKQSKHKGEANEQLPKSN